MTKIGPDQVQGFKNIGSAGDTNAALKQRLDDENAKYESAINELVTGYQKAQSTFGQAAQINVPERQKPSLQEGIALTIADALRGIVDTSPRKFRQERAPSVQTFQGLKDQEYERQLQTENIRYQNEAQRIAASQRSAEVGLEGLKAKTEGAQNAARTAGEEYRFGRAQGHAEAQAAITNEFARQGIQLDKDRIRIQGEQWQKDFDRLNRTEAENLQREQAGYEAQGMSPADARKMAYADKMLSVNSAELKGLELKRTKELYDALPVSAEVKHTLWQREAEIESHDENMKTLRKQREVMGRNSRSQDPFAMMMFNDFRSDIGSEIEKANQNIDFYTNGLEEIRLGTGDYKFANDEARGMAIKTYKRKIEDWTTRRNDAISLRNEITRNAAGK